MFRSCTYTQYPLQPIRLVLNEIVLPLYPLPSLLDRFRVLSFRLALHVGRTLSRTEDPDLDPRATYSKDPVFFRVFVIDEYHRPYADRHLLFLIVRSMNVSHAPMSRFESNRFERVHPVRKAVTVSADYRIHRPYL